MGRKTGRQMLVSTPLPIVVGQRNRPKSPLQPTAGNERFGSGRAQIRAPLEGGVTLAEAVLPRTAPVNAISWHYLASNSDAATVTADVGAFVESSPSPGTNRTCLRTHGEGAINRNLPGRNAAKLRRGLWLRSRSRRTLRIRARCGSATLAASCALESPFEKQRHGCIVDGEALAVSAGASFAGVAESRRAQRSKTIDCQRRRVDVASSEDMVSAGNHAWGAGHTSRIEQFARANWRPEVAIEHSASLRSCVERLRTSWDEFA